MDSLKIQSLLHSVPEHYSLKEGEPVTVELPRIPFTRHTEFLKLHCEVHDDTGIFSKNGAELDKTDFEGLHYPQLIQGMALRPGTSEIIVTPIHALSGEAISDVDPLVITIQVTR